MEARWLRQGKQLVGWEQWGNRGLRGRGAARILGSLGSTGALGVVLSLVLMACGGASEEPREDAQVARDAATGTDGTAGPDVAAECPAPPEPTDPVGPCAAWQCSPVAPPACWSCGAVPARQGEACDEVAGGVCRDGQCVAETPVSDPGEPGSEGSSTATVDVSVAGETVPVTVYLPAGSGPYPVVLFSHGFQLSAALYASYGAHLASWGYVTLMPELPGSLLSPWSHRALADLLVGLIDWVDGGGADPAGPLAGKADASRLALAGHSMGGKLAFLVASEDSRVDAVFGVDPVDAAGGGFGPSDPAEYPSVTPERMGSITVPFVALGETTNATGGSLGQACAPADENFEQYYAHAASPALLIEVLGASHMSFLDDPHCGLPCNLCPAGSDDPGETRRLTRRYLVAFLNDALGQQSIYRSYLVGSEMAADVAAGRVRSESKNGF